MIIKKATEKERREAVGIARELKEWFTPDGIKNMIVDFSLNQVIVAIEDKRVAGFLCYTSYCGKMQLIWMGVKRGIQRKGVGVALLRWLENETKKLGLYTIEVETLPDEDNYMPYKQTRDFYYKKGFKKIFYKKARVKGWDDQIVMEKIINL